MIIRRDTLEQALDEGEAQALSGASTIVVSRHWWDGLSAHEREAYRHRAERDRKAESEGEQVRKEHLHMEGRIPQHDRQQPADRPHGDPQRADDQRSALQPLPGNVAVVDRTGHGCVLAVPPNSFCRSWGSRMSSGRVSHPATDSSRKRDRWR